MPGGHHSLTRGLGTSQCFRLLPGTRHAGRGSCHPSMPRALMPPALGGGMDEHGLRQLSQSHPSPHGVGPSVAAGHEPWGLQGLASHKRAALLGPQGGGKPWAVVEGHQWDLAGVSPANDQSKCPHYDLEVGDQLPVPRVVHGHGGIARAWRTSTPAMSRTRRCCHRCPTKTRPWRCWATLMTRT